MTNMAQEDKELLFKDLCARLLYGVICNTNKGDGYLCSLNQTIFGNEYGINIQATKRDYFNDKEEIIKPYLRPISSMTEEEQKEFDSFCVIDEDVWKENGIIGDTNQSKIMSDAMDWLNEHMFDYRGLIGMGLALEAPDGMYD